MANLAPLKMAGFQAPMTGRFWAPTDMKCAESTKLAYAVTVFDHAMIQLGGLAFAVSRNKIRDPEQAAELAARVANWISLVCPEYLAG